jgi:hypothetical protein
VEVSGVEPFAYAPVGDDVLRMAWLDWLGPAVVALPALALSDKIQLHGRVVARVPYDWAPFHLTSTFRSSGRLFWPCAYVLVLAALELVFALPRPIAVRMVLAGLLLQAFDLTGFAAKVRALTAEAAAPAHWQRTSSRKWEPLIASADVVEFQPPDPHLDQKLFYEIAWRATSLGRPVNVMYTARPNPQQKAFETAARDRFLLGRLDPRRLYVLTDGCVPAGLDPGRLKLVNRVTVIPPAGARYPFALRPAPAPAPFPTGQVVSAAPRTAEFRCMLGRDWSALEDWGVWSSGSAPDLIFRLGEPPSGDLVLTVVAQPFPAQGQGVAVSVRGRVLARWALAGGFTEHRLRIPRALAADGLLHVELKVDHPRAPGPEDSRRLGVGLRSVRLDVAE